MAGGLRPSALRHSGTCSGNGCRNCESQVTGPDLCRKYTDAVGAPDVFSVNTEIVEDRRHPFRLTLPWFLFRYALDGTIQVNAFGHARGHKAFKGTSYDDAGGHSAAPASLFFKKKLTKYDSQLFSCDNEDRDTPNFRTRPAAVLTSQHLSTYTSTVIGSSQPHGYRSGSEWNSY
jgi:hypothetical protein